MKALITSSPVGKQCGIPFKKAIWKELYRTYEWRDKLIFVLFYENTRKLRSTKEQNARHRLLNDKIWIECDAIEIWIVYSEFRTSNFECIRIHSINCCIFIHFIHIQSICTDLLAHTLTQCNRLCGSW